MINDLLEIFWLLILLVLIYIIDFKVMTTKDKYSYGRGNLRLASILIVCRIVYILYMQIKM